MKWSLDGARLGDMVRVKLGSIYHYGIFVSDEEVVQFGLAPTSRRALKDSEVEVCASSIEQFLCGGFLEVGIPERKDGKTRKPKTVVEYARSCIGKKGYNILYNNCEHFAYECLFGQKKCTQADDVRKLFRSMPILHVYTAKIPDEKLCLDAVYPEQRKNEILECSNQKVRKEKYYAWELLKYALSRTFGYKIQNLQFDKDKNGKWSVKECFFSISHSNGIVAVALSRSAVGVDVEAINKQKQRVLEKVLTRKERKAFDKVCESERATWLTQKWTEKESIFKAGKEAKFRPSKTQTNGGRTKSKTVCLDGVEYVLTVCSDNIAQLKYFEDISLVKQND